MLKLFFFTVKNVETWKDRKWGDKNYVHFPPCEFDRADGEVERYIINFYYILIIKPLLG